MNRNDAIQKAAACAAWCSADVVDAAQVPGELWPTFLADLDEVLIARGLGVESDDVLWLSDDAAVGPLANTFRSSADWFATRTQERCGLAMWRAFGANGLWLGYELERASQPDAGELIASLFFIFQAIDSGLWQGEPLETGFFMLFDLAQPPLAGPLDAQFLEVLAGVLELRDDRCRTAALHGLNHCHDPGRREVIDRWLARTPQLTAGMVEFARVCRDGKYM